MLFDTLRAFCARGCSLSTAISLGSLGRYVGRSGTSCTAGGCTVVEMRRRGSDQIEGSPPRTDAGRSIDQPTD